MSGPQINEALAGHIFRHADNSNTTLQSFRTDGVTYYYEGSAQSEGRWEVRKDQYCGRWQQQKNWYCYSVIASGAELTFISAARVRYTVQRID